MSNFQCRNGTQRFIYVLKLEDGCYYVGETNNIERRYEQHLNGKYSAQWTQLHKPLEIIFTTPVKNDSDENNYTRLYMKKIKGGINKVRGGNYSRPVLRRKIFSGLAKRLKFIHESMSIEEIEEVFQEFKAAKYDTKIETIESKLLKKLCFDTEITEEKSEEINNFNIKDLRAKEKERQKKEKEKNN